MGPIDLGRNKNFKGIKTCSTKSINRKFSSKKMKGIKINIIIKINKIMGYLAFY